jgi:hypothetical protein
MPNKIPASSGGGGGGGVSLDSVSFDSVVDLTDGSWTLVEPDPANPVVQSVTFSGGFNTVTLNASSGGSDFRWSSSASSNNAPRWYRAWNYTGTTTRATSTDLSNYTNVLEVDRSINEFDFELVGGVCLDPLTTTRTSIHGMGAGISNQVSTAAGCRFGHWRTSSMPTNPASAAIVKTVQTGQYGARHMGTSVFMLLNASNEHVQRGSTTGANTIAAGVDLFQIVGVGTRTNTTTIGAGDRVKFKLYQGSLKWSLP